MATAPARAMATAGRRSGRLLLAWLVCGVAIAAYASKLADVVDSGRDAAHPAIDLSIYLQAAAHVRAGLPLYQVQVDIGRSGWPYVYPPLLAELLVPFTSYTSTWWIWTALSVACWLASLAVLLWELRAQVWYALPAEWRPVLVAGLVLWPSVILDLLVGQLQLPLLALLVATWWALGRGRWPIAGLLLGLAVALKPLPVTALVCLLVAGHGRAGGLAGVVAALLVLVSFGLAGWDQVPVYLFQAGPALDHVMATNPNNGTLAMSLSLLVGAPAVPDWLAISIGLAVVGVATLAAWRWRPAGRSALALGVSACLLASPILESHYLLLAYVPIVDAFANADARGRAVVALLVAVLIGSAFVLALPGDPPPLLAFKCGLPVSVLLGVFCVQCLELRAASRRRAAPQPR